MFSERQPPHKQHVIPITLLTILGCLSILLIPSSYAQVTNPSTGDTIAQYCSSGVCHTPGTNPIINKTSPQIQPVQNNDTIGSVKLTQSCIGNVCGNVASVTQLGKIGIQLSQVCLADLKNHLNSTCLNYNDLKQFDNTNPLYAGLWVKQPYEHRLSPKIKNHENFNPNPWPVMVDPNPDYTIAARMIIVDTHFTWTNQNDSSDRGLSAKSYVDRYVSDDCQEARVGPNLKLIQDTISYIESNCTAKTLDVTQYSNQTEIPFSYNNPYSTLHLSDYLSSFLHGHSYFNTTETTAGLGPSDCIRHQCSYTDPYKKPGW